MTRRRRGRASAAPESLPARLTGYALAWALVLALGAVGYGALTSGPASAPYSLPTFAPLPTDAPATPAPPAPTDRPGRPVVKDPAPALDCGGADPADPEIDPEIDCVPA